MKKTTSCVIIFMLIITAFTITSVSSQESSIYDYSSFVGEWHKIDPDGLNGDVPLEIIEVTDNKKIRFSLDDGEEVEIDIVNNQAQWTENWWDGEMGLTLTFYDDYIHLQYSRYSHEWYNEIIFVSDSVKPKKMQADADEGIKIVINGEEIISDVAPMTMPVYADGEYVGDRVMVPIRAISEKLNFDVYWNQENKGITIYRKNNIYCMWVEKDTAFHMDGYDLENGYKMDVTPTVINDRTLVPVRAVAEVLGAEVEWQGETGTVDIKYDLGTLENNTGVAEQVHSIEELLNSGYVVLRSYLDGTIDVTKGKFILENGKEIAFELYPQLAPVTASKFVALANAGAYDGTIFHRVIDDFMAQGGGYTPDGSYIQTEAIIGEFVQNGLFNIIGHDRGVISYARTNEFNSGSSQFFIVQKDSPHLDGSYAAFGKVTEGMDVVDEICKAETDENDKPIEDIVIKQVIIEVDDEVHTED